MSPPKKNKTKKNKGHTREKQKDLAVCPNWRLDHVDI